MNDSILSSKYDYGSVNMDDFPLDDEDESSIQFLNPDMRRRSVLQKLNENYKTQRQYSYHEVCRLCNTKCIFAILMLVIFIFFTTTFTGTIFFNHNFGIVTYDFIVVGGGAAGSIITRKLVDAGARVLLVEGGGATQFTLGGKGYGDAPVSALDIPFLWPAAVENNDVVWDQLKQQDVYVGKGLGGSGVINSMISLRALPEDIQAWNLSSITWNKILQQYKALELYQPKLGERATTTTTTTAEVEDYRGSTGPIMTIPSHCDDTLSTLFLQAAQHHNLTTLNDFNHPITPRIGFGCYDFLIRHGERDSAGRAFLGDFVTASTLPPNNKLPLTIELHAQVQRILLAKYNPNTGMTYSSSSSFAYNPFTSTTSTSTTPTKSSTKPSSDSTPPLTVDGGSSSSGEENLQSWAYGIEYWKDGVLKTATLGGNAFLGRNRQHDFSGQRCIILTAGAIMTPKLLMNSGIGDRQDLQAAGIEVNYHHPKIGKTLQDHPMTYLVFQASPVLLASYPAMYSLPHAWWEYFHAVTSLHNLTLTMHGNPSSITNPYSNNKNKNNSGKEGKKKNPKNEEVQEGAVPQVLQERLGVLGTAGFSLGGFLASPWATAATLPDLQITILPTLDAFPAVREALIAKKKAQGAQDTTDDVDHDDQDDAASSPASTPNKLPLQPILVTIALLQPEIRQHMKFNSVDPIASAPLISSVEAAALTTKDRLRLTWGIDTIRKIFHTLPLKQSWQEELLPGETTDLATWIPEHVLSWHNYVGSVPMGTEPQSSVVDEDFRVRNVAALRIADASAIPLIPRGNVHSTVLAMASLAAEKILATDT